MTMSANGERSRSEVPEGPPSFPVSVILGRRTVRRGPVTVPSWELSGVVAGTPRIGEGMAGEGPARGRPIHRDGDREELLWTGLAVRLDPGSTESYWFNLVSLKPSLQVICQPDPETGLSPVAVTADHDLGVAHMEADDTVFAAPMPPEMIPWLERFVMDNYRPQPRKQRKREDWKKEPGHE